MAALEVTWRLGGTGGATSEEAAEEARAQRLSEEEEEASAADFAMVDADELVDEDDVLATAAGAAIGGVGLVGRGSAGEGVTTIGTNDLVPLMALARSVRGLMHYPGNEAWRWRAVKLWTRLLRAEVLEIDPKKASPEADLVRFSNVCSLLS